MHAILSFYPAILLYGLVALLKLAGTDWGTDLPGMHAGIGAIFLLFGASVCHLVFVCQLGKRQQGYRLPQSFWVVATIAFVLMFLDSSFGVHERYALALGVPEVVFLLTYGIMFNAVALMNIRKVGIAFLLFFGAFGLCAVGAIAGDMSAAHEGMFTFNGKQYSFEQTLETLGCLMLACAFAVPAVRTLTLPLAIADTPSQRPAASMQAVRNADVQRQPDNAGAAPLPANPPAIQPGILGPGAANPV